MDKLMEMWIVILFDNEESRPSDSVLEVYGPFESENDADTWAKEKWDEIPEEEQEFRGLAVEKFLSRGG